MFRRLQDPCKKKKKKYHHGQLYNLTAGLEDHSIKRIFIAYLLIVATCFTELHSLYYLKWWCLVNLSWETFASHLGTAVVLSPAFCPGMTSQV